MIARAVLLQMANSKKMESIVKNSSLSSRTTRRFVAGESVQSVTDPVRELNQKGITVSLDFLGESVSTKAEVEETISTYIALFRHISAEKLNANVSIKLTALGLDIDPEFCYQNMVSLLNEAGPEQFIRIDMEGSPYTQITLDLFNRLWHQGGYRNVGVVIQAYLRRSAADIEDLIETGARVRLCKGAYKESSDIAFPEKSQVDENFISLMQRLVSAGNYPGIATHDPDMIRATVDFVEKNHISPDRFEFQMLYGIRRDLQDDIVRRGFRMRVYTPFGTHWYPYFMRRLAERPANLWFVIKNMFRK